MRRNFLLILLLIALNSNAQLTTDSSAVINSIYSQSAIEQSAIYRLDSLNRDSLNEAIRKIVFKSEEWEQDKANVRSNWLTIFLVVGSVLGGIRILLLIRR